MENIEEVRREAEEIRRKVSQNIEEFCDLLRKIAGEAQDGGKTRIVAAVQRAEKRIEGTARRVESRMENTLEMMAKWAVNSGAESEVNVGPLVTREMDLRDYSSIEVDHAFNVEINHSDSYRVAITAGEKLFEHINATKSGSTLRISLKPCLFRFNPRTLKILIEMPVLKKLRMAAATRGTVRGFSSTETFDLYLSGASTLDIDIEAGKTKLEISGASRLGGYMKLDDAEFILSGSSRAQLNGSCNSAILNAWGAGTLELADFVCNDAEVHLKGASRATIHSDGKLDLDLSGASKLSYIGNPILNDVNVSGAPTIVHR